MFLSSSLSLPGMWFWMSGSCSNIAISWLKSVVMHWAGLRLRVPHPPPEMDNVILILKKQKRDSEGCQLKILAGYLRSHTLLEQTVLTICSSMIGIYFIFNPSLCSWLAVAHLQGGTEGPRRSGSVSEGDKEAGVGGDRCTEPCHPRQGGAFAQKQWVPRASDVFKQRKNVVLITRSLWLLSEERAAWGEREQDLERTPHPSATRHWSAFFLCHLILHRFWVTWADFFFCLLIKFWCLI